MDHPLCINCNHARNLMPGRMTETSWWCEHPKAIEVKEQTSLVTGETEYNYQPCTLVRKNEAMCGLIGKWYDPNPIEAGKQQRQEI